jgi:tetratricopeptide (TPR) repeat protein
MSWLEFHTQSEKFASQAESLCHQQDSIGAVESYRLAAAAEKQALDNLDTNKTRTLGITVVSAASLYFKAKDFSQAKELANQWLQSNLLPSFAIKELQSLLLVIYLDELLKIPAAKPVKTRTQTLSDNVGRYYPHNPQREYGTGDLISFKIPMKNDIDLPKHTRNSKVVSFHADIDMAIKNLLSGMKNQNLLSGSIALGQLVDIYRKLGNIAFVELWGDSKNVDRSPELLAAIREASAKQEKPESES